MKEGLSATRCPMQEMLVRSERHGVAPLTWQDVGGQPVAFSHGGLCAPPASAPAFQKETRCTN